MGFQGNLQSYSLGDLFQNISGNNRTGMLKIFGPSGEKYIYFAEGQIRLLAHGKRYKGMLKKVLADSQLIAREQLEKAAQEAAESSTALSNVVLDKGYIEEENLKALIHFAIEEDIYDLFTWTEANFEFIDGAPDNEIFDGELFSEENAFNTDHLVMEAARRSDEWGRIREVITSDENVFITINEARNRLESFEQESAPLQIIMHVDGYRSVREVINSSGLGKFDVYEGLFYLYQQGIIRHKTFEELFQTGVELKGKQQLQKAIVFLKRALDVQDNVECRRNLAELFEMQGEQKSASEQYMTLGRAYKKNGDEESALESFRKVTELDPVLAEPHNEIAEIFSAQEMVDEAVQEYVQYSHKLLDAKNIQKSREISYRILNIKPQNYEAHRLLAKGYLWEGNSESAIAEYKALAQSLLANMKPKQAIKRYDEILEQDCNFPTVKEGVKDFLLKSGEVKSYGLMRFLLTLIILVILGGAGLAGYFVYNKTLHQEKGKKKLRKLVEVYQERWADGEHKDVLNQTKELIKNFYMYDDIKKEAEEIQRKTQNDLKEKVKIKIATAESLIENSKYEQALIILDYLLKEYSQGFPFLKEEIDQWKKKRETIVSQVIGKKIEEHYKAAVKDFEKGLWAKALETDLKGLTVESVNVFTKEDLERLKSHINEETLLAGKGDIEKASKDIEDLKKILGRSDVQKDIMLKLLNCIDFYKEMLEYYFNGDKLFERYEKLDKLKDPKYGPDVLKTILVRAKDLGSKKAKILLKEFDNKQARELLAEANKLENEGKFEEALTTLRKLLKKYKHTEAAKDVQYFFVVNSKPEGVSVSINGKPKGKTDDKEIHRYKPGTGISVKLHSPTFTSKEFSVNENKAVYSVKMQRGYEKKFHCKADINCELLLSDGSLYFGDSGGHLYSISLDTFKNNWDGIERPFRMGITGTPFFYRDNYYLGTATGDVIALAQTGSNKAWPFKGSRKSKVIGFAACENPIKMNEFLLFYATEKGEIFALDADTGELKWKVTRIPGIESGLVVKDTGLYTGGTDGIIYGIDIFNHKNVKTLFQISVRKSIFSDFTFIKGSTLFFGAKDRRIYSVDISRGLSRGAIKNNDFQTNDLVKSKIHIDGNKIYAGSYDHHLYCLSFSPSFKMKKEWVFEAEDRIEAEAAVLDNMVYFADISGNLYAVNTSKIQKNAIKVQAEWKYATKGRIRSGLKIWKSYLIVPTEKGMIYAFKIK
ncbi:PQQ-binding-like beta-propeller repeat protein [Planctomycetota bacterium]